MTMRRVISWTISVASALFAVAGFGLLFMPAASAASGGRLEVRGAALAHMMRGG